MNEIWQQFYDTSLQDLYIHVYNQEVVDRIMDKAVNNYLPEDGDPEQVELSQDSILAKTVKTHRRRRRHGYTITNMGISEVFNELSFTRQNNMAALSL